MTDAPAMPISTNVPTPDTKSASGTAARRGASATASSRPPAAASRIGSLTIRFRKPGMAVGSSASVRWRPRSSAEPLV